MMPSVLEIRKELHIRKREANTRLIPQYLEGLQTVLDLDGTEQDYNLQLFDRAKSYEEMLSTARTLLETHGVCPACGTQDLLADFAADVVCRKCDTVIN